VRRTAVIAGASAQTAGHGGLTWVFLQYVLGLRRLDWDVLFLDRLEPDMCVDAAGRHVSVEDSVNLRYLTEVMERFGLGDRWSLVYEGKRFFGLSREEVLERVRHCAFLLNVMGYLNHEEILAAAPRRVFLDIDPGFPQMWRELGLADVFDGHDHFVTVGANVGQPACTIPTCGFRWIGTPQPVVLDHWPPTTRGGAFTSIVSWRGPFAPVRYRGRTYGLRVHEFRKFAALPGLSGRAFEIALEIHSSDQKDRAMLEAEGWSLVDPAAVAGDPWAYREYIQRSAGELGVAKSMYVDTRSGWFSDRSICYLASGKPVLVQDTGLGDRYPIGEGLLTFSTLDEALAGVEAICQDYERHARTARLVAEEHFASDGVLGRLLQHLEVE
jgi:hypothetical protein